MADDQENHEIRNAEKDYENRFNKLDMKFGETTPTVDPLHDNDSAFFFLLAVVAVIFVLASAIVWAWRYDRKLARRNRKNASQPMRFEASDVEKELLQPLAESKLQPVEEVPELDDTVRRKAVSDFNIGYDALGIRSRDQQQDRQHRKMSSRPESVSNRATLSDDVTSHKQPLFRRISAKKD